MTNRKYHFVLYRRLPEDANRNSYFNLMCSENVNAFHYEVDDVIVAELAKARHRNEGVVNVAGCGKMEKLILKPSDKEYAHLMLRYTNKKYANPDGE